MLPYPKFNLGGSSGDLPYDSCWTAFCRDRQMLVNTDLVFKGLGLRSARIAPVFRLPYDEIGEEGKERGDGDSNKR